MGSSWKGERLEIVGRISVIIFGEQERSIFYFFFFLIFFKLLFVYMYVYIILYSVLNY